MKQVQYKGYRINWYQRPSPYNCEAEVYERGNLVAIVDTLVEARTFIDEREGTPPETTPAETFEMKWRGIEYQIPARDNQKQKLYNAETEAFKDTGDKFADLAEAQRFANNVVKSATWKRLRQQLDLCQFHSRFQAEYQQRKRKGIVELEQWGAHGNATAFPGQWRIKLPTWALNRQVILHELAHVVCGPRVGHQWIFARVFEDLVSRFMGREHAKKLRESFRKHGVRRSPPRVMTAEQKAALAARGVAALAAWKAAKGEVK